MSGLSSVIVVLLAKQACQHILHGQAGGYADGLQHGDGREVGAAETNGAEDLLGEVLLLGGLEDEAEVHDAGLGHLEAHHAHLRIGSERGTYGGDHLVLGDIHVDLDVVVALEGELGELLADDAGDGADALLDELGAVESRNARSVDGSKGYINDGGDKLDVLGLPLVAVVVQEGLDHSVGSGVGALQVGGDGVVLAEGDVLLLVGDLRGGARRQHIRQCCTRRRSP